VAAEPCAHIRLARAQDAGLLPAIEHCAAQAFRAIEGLGWLADAASISVERHRQWIALSTCWVVVDTHDQLQGFLSAERFGDDLHIHEVSVAQPVQGQGWGRRLVETAIYHARTQQLRAVTLTTFKHVPWNAPFYRRLGFEPHTHQRLENTLADEYAQGFVPGSRCAMAYKVVCPNPS